MSKFTVGSKINARRKRSVTTSGARTRKLVEDRTDVPYAAPHISFDHSTGKHVDMPPRPNPTVEVQKNMTEHLKASGRLPEPEACPHITREIPRKSAPKSDTIKIMPAWEIDPDIAAHVLTTYWQQRYWSGMIEANRRSQAAPDWAPPAEQPKEQAGEAQDTKTLDITEAIAAKLAADMSQPEQLAAHKRVNWTGGVRDPYKPLQDDWIIAAHVIRFNQPFYTVEQMLVIYQLQAIGPKGPRYQDKMKDYSNDRFYIKPDELWHDEVTRTVAWIMEPESIDDQLTRWEWLDNRQRDKRAWACAQQQAAGLVEEMSNWEAAA